MNRLLLLFFIIISGVTYAQPASSYFPSSTGYKWFFRDTPLDTLNQPQYNLSTYRIDSFATSSTYMGLNANFVNSKRGLANINIQGPVTDTSYYNFQGNDGYVYFSLGNLDTIQYIQELGLVNFLRGLEKWYAVYKFTNTVNATYNLFTKDTTITYNGTQYPLRLKTDVKRLADETITTINGTVTTKKFLSTINLAYLLTIPPFPAIPVTLVNKPDTTWIASGVWIVKSVSPSIVVDLTSLGQQVRFYIPGYIQELTNPPSSISQISTEVPDKFSLSQNFPNPFNPSTKISFDINTASNVQLVIFNSLGKEVKTLVNENLKAGKYEVNFNASDLSSGAYYYRLTADNKSISKTMFLVK